MTSIIEQAIHLEEAARDNYREAAQATSDPSAAKILEFLADEEDGHAKSLRAMTDVSVEKGSDVLQSAKDWIRGVVEGGATAISSDAGLLSSLRRALTIEQTTESFYRDHANTAEDVSVKELFAQLADVEKQHFLLVGSLVEYFDRPNEWVESAEFGLRNDY